MSALDGGFAAAMLAVSETIAPMHDWLAGERAFFAGQGYTADEARAMAAATYVTVFGTSPVAAH